MFYVFKCSECNAQIETQQSIKEEKIIPKCPNCNNSSKVVPVITSSYFILNGSGYYSKETRS
jgi:putative FmdB family regulatory protein